MRSETRRRPNTPTYSAAVDPEELEITLIRDIPAGVSGPIGSYNLIPTPGFDADDEAHMAALCAKAAEMLFEAGYLVAGEWQRNRYTRSRYVALTSMHAGD